MDEQITPQNNTPKNKSNLSIILFSLVATLIIFASAGVVFAQYKQNEKDKAILQNKINILEKQITQTQRLVDLKDQEKIELLKEISQLKNPQANEQVKCDTSKIIDSSRELVGGQKVYCVKDGQMYHNGVEVENADLDSFEVLYIEMGNTGIAKDKNHAYRGIEIIPDVDAKTFTRLERNYFKDKDNVYHYKYGFAKIDFLDVNSFEVLGGEEGSYVKDKNFVYQDLEALEKIEGADPKTFNLDNKKEYIEREPKWMIHNNAQEGYSISFPSVFHAEEHNILNYDPEDSSDNTQNRIKIQIQKHNLSSDFKTMEEYKNYLLNIDDNLVEKAQNINLGDFITMSQYTKNGPGGAFVSYLAFKGDSYYNIIAFESGYSKNKELIKDIVKTFSIL